MLSTILRRISVMAAAVALVGCAARVPVAYDSPAPRLEPHGPVVALRRVAEQRADRTLDSAFTNDVLEAVDAALQGRIAARGFASNVIALPEPLNRTAQQLRIQGVTIVLEPVLEELRWEVPDYRDQKTTSFFLNIFTLGIGGLIYRMTSTDAYAHARLRVRMMDVRSLREQSGTYTGSAKVETTKGQADSGEMKRRLTAAALRQAAERFSADVAKFAGW